MNNDEQTARDSTLLLFMTAMEGRRVPLHMSYKLLAITNLNQTQHGAGSRNNHGARAACIITLILVCAEKQIPRH